MHPIQASKITQMVVSVAKTGGSTTTANLDMKGYEYATIIVNLSKGADTAAATTAPTISLLEADDTNATSFGTIVADVALTQVPDRSIVRHVDMRGRKRYLRVSVTLGATTNCNATYGVIGIQSKAELEPASTTDMVGNTSNDIINLI